MGVELNAQRHLDDKITMGRSCGWGNGRLNMVRFKAYNVVQCHDKLFIPKFNGLQKNMPTTARSSLHICDACWEYFISLKSQHVKNEKKIVRLHGKNLSFNKLLTLVILTRNTILCKLLQYFIS
jgi:hypothetical protein